MKYGLVVYQKTENLGDDILSFAEERFLPQIDYIIDRENMDTFIPAEKEQVSVICNGWFLHAKTHWPPSPYIRPLFTGIHFNGGSASMESNYDYLDGIGASYLRKNGPVGCRDTATLDMLAQRNIPAYFSGCLSLTLQPFEGIMKGSNVVLSDVSESVKKKVEDLFDQCNLQTVTHLIPKEEKNMDWNARRDRVQKILKLYQSAELVITTRLHCALPCLALGTKVLLLLDSGEDSVKRKGCYLQYLNYCKESDFLNWTRSDVDSLENSTLFQTLRDSLIDSCESFIKTTKEDTSEDLPELLTFESMYREKVIWQRRLLPNSDFFVSQEKYDDVCAWGTAMEGKVNALRTITEKNDVCEIHLKEEALTESPCQEKQLVEEQQKIAELEKLLHASYIERERISNLLKVAETEKQFLWNRISIQEKILNSKAMKIVSWFWRVRDKLFRKK